MDELRREPSWFGVARNTARIYLVRKLLASPARTAAIAAAICLAVLAGGWSAWNPSSGPAPSVPAPTSGTTALPSDDGTEQARSQREELVLDPADVRRLAANRRLMLGSSARRQLASGHVDRRLGATLDALLDRHMIQVRSFAATDRGALLSTMSIDCIDELPVRPRSPQTVAVLDLLRRQPVALRPASAQLTGTGKTAAIVVSYSAANS